jgi:hypothetical protein
VRAIDGGLTTPEINALSLPPPKKKGRSKKKGTP